MIIINHSTLEAPRSLLWQLISTCWLISKAKQGQKAKHWEIQSLLARLSTQKYSRREWTIHANSVAKKITWMCPCSHQQSNSNQDS